MRRGLEERRVGGQTAGGVILLWEPVEIGQGELALSVCTRGHP